MIISFQDTEIASSPYWYSMQILISDSRWFGFIGNSFRYDLGGGGSVLMQVPIEEHLFWASAGRAEFSPG